MTTNNFSRREFFKLSGIGLAGAVNFSAFERTLYVGTYTSGKSDGIYIYRMDQMSGELKHIGSVKSENPSFLTVDPNRRFLYAVNENPTGAVSSFRIDPTTKQLTFLNQQSSQGADPCHLTVDKRGKSLLVANYTGGNVAVLPVQRDGGLGEAIDVRQHKGSGPREQQKSAHAHCIKLDRNNRHAFAADLGSDKVFIYRFNSFNGKLEPAQQASAFLHGGAGPRHLDFHPNGTYLYVINELDSSLTTFKYDSQKGALNAFETVSTLPRDFVGTSYCADIHVSRSGRFVYGSNRGHNSIVVFAIDPRTGRLNLVEHVSTEGKWPRNFTIDPTGRFLLVANQHTDNVVVFRIDAQTGRLTQTGHSAEIPTPVCLQFF
ncbi:MAG TPA: lactonase family protein [Pyrinomonadaceae bacterium]|nr:lactonase family protein [Pyrinomonadaceae bacterium]